MAFTSHNLLKSETPLKKILAMKNKSRNWLFIGHFATTPSHTQRGEKKKPYMAQRGTQLSPRAQDVGTAAPRAIPPADAGHLGPFPSPGLDAL